ncbi:Mrp/NBP35 family ATP-binding protein [Gulosibacter molinativorax]|uniref:Mrp/NBP35 family ATP-binding protein n=1 Tax=Gulosibacter molinativorax TaxID=256821 RepID=UPI0003FEA80D|nr:P-loop NTPase [Gulosibacter molinativorax]QUY62016.1 Iron-sulfur cluster carrier protein [Gulosibacter molinativorax]
MPDPRIQRIRQELGQVIDPELRRPITELGMVGEISVPDNAPIQVDIKLTIVSCPRADDIEKDARAAVRRAVGDDPYVVSVGVMSREERRALTERLRGSKPKEHPFGKDSLTRVIAITSGKGGVGKSTVTANLAAAMAADGLDVGVIDADVFGFSIPSLLGMAPGTQPTQVGEMMLPPIAHDVKAVSIGMFLQSPDEIVAWRGPMLHRTLEQFLKDVYFGEPDVLLLDLPPGTGDVALSLGQLLPHSEVVVVTTPQPAAADVAWRSGAVAKKTGQRVVGVIETMSPAIGPDGTEFALFGSGGGEEVARRFGVPLLGNVPLSEQLRSDGDAGTPIVLAHPDDPAAVALRDAARRLYQRPRGLAGKPLGVSVN